MIEYVILGTSHDLQGLSTFEKPALDAIRKHSVRLVAEEYTCDNTSMVSVTTKRLHIPYLEVDLFPSEWAEYKIDREMQARKQFLQDQDCRLSHADAVRGASGWKKSRRVWIAVEYSLSAAISTWISSPRGLGSVAAGWWRRACSPQTCAAEVQPWF